MSIREAPNHEHRNRQSRSYPYLCAEENAALLNVLRGLPLPPTTSSTTEELRYMPEGNKDSGWRNCLNIVERHDKDLCQAHREQIDTLLVFAGLFSAVVTAFAAESYQWLLEDPADTSVDLLRDVVRLLAQNLNQTSLLIPSTATRLSDATVTRINIFWFLSLSLSLSAALVGILCKQWLREFERDVGKTPEIALAIRYHKYLGLGYWKVGSIVNSVPILLQVSLALFFTGILELLWRLHTTVAICVSAVAGMTLAFYMATTLVPLIQYAYIILRCCGGQRFRNELYTMGLAFTEPQCAFKSAQAWLALRIFQPVIDYIIKTYRPAFASKVPPNGPLVLKPADSWVTFDLNWMQRHNFLHFGGKSAFKTLAWIAENLEETRLSSSIWHCIWGRWLKNRSENAIERAAMDIECVARSYPEPHHISEDLSLTAHVRGQAAILQCLLHPTLSVDTAVEMILRIAPSIGVDSIWTIKALYTVQSVYNDQTIRISDDMTSGLLHLALQQTQAIIRAGGNLESQGTRAFRAVFDILFWGSSHDRRVLPVIERLPPTSNGEYAHCIILSTITYYEGLHSGPARLHEYPGIIFPARLAAMVAELFPHFAQGELSGWPPARAILLKLLEISHANNCGGVALTSGAAPAPPPVAPVRTDNEEHSPSAADFVPTILSGDDESSSPAVAVAENAVSTHVEGDADNEAADLNAAAILPAASPVSVEL